jgi:uncharacterized protein YcbX
VTSPPTVTVTRLALTPVKGFGLQEVDAVELTAQGVPGDRAFFLVDDQERLFSATRSPAFLPYWVAFDAHTGRFTVGRGSDELLSEVVELGEPVRAHFFADRYATGRVVRGRWSEWLSQVAGQPLRLVHVDEPGEGYDVHPVTLVSEASVAALGQEDDGGPLDVRRFRMTVTVGGVPPFAEDGWQGRTLRIGGATLRAGGPVKRCAAIQKHPDGDPAEVNALRLINEVRGPADSELGRGLLLGVYGEVLVPGTVRVGDTVEQVSAPDRDGRDVGAALGSG